MRVIVMGVSNSGKSAAAEQLARALDARLLDADDFHPASNVAKMSNGIPLSDDDRWPWLERLSAELSAHDRVVLACSALRRSYREVLRTAGSVRFVFLEVDEATATDRAERRPGHFMGADMVESQFQTLERPDADEHDVVTIDATSSFGDVVAAALRSVLSNGPQER